MNFKQQLIYQFQLAALELFKLISRFTLQENENGIKEIKVTISHQLMEYLQRLNIILKAKNGKNSGIQSLNSNLIVKSQVLVNQQKPRIKKRQIYSCQGLANTELHSKLKKLEKPHEQEIVQLNSLIEKMSTEIQILKAENQNLKLLLQDKKGKINARQVKFSFRLKLQLPNQYQQKKTQSQIYRKLKKKSNYKLQKTDQQQIRCKLRKK